MDRYVARRGGRFVWCVSSTLRDPQLFACDSIGAAFCACGSLPSFTLPSARPACFPHRPPARSRASAAGFLCSSAPFSHRTPPSSFHCFRLRLSARDRCFAVNISSFLIGRFGTKAVWVKRKNEKERKSESPKTCPRPFRVFCVGVFIVLRSYKGA
jgi:hypothetical protein